MRAATAKAGLVVRLCAGRCRLRTVLRRGATRTSCASPQFKRRSRGARGKQLASLSRRRHEHHVWAGAAASWPRPPAQYPASRREQDKPRVAATQQATRTRFSSRKPDTTGSVCPDQLGAHRLRNSGVLQTGAARIQALTTKHNAGAWPGESSHQRDTTRRHDVQSHDVQSHDRGLPPDARVPCHDP